MQDFKVIRKGCDVCGELRADQGRYTIVGECNQSSCNCKEYFLGKSETMKQNCSTANTALSKFSTHVIALGTLVCSKLQQQNVITDRNTYYWIEYLAFIYSIIFCYDAWYFQTLKGCNSLVNKCYRFKVSPSQNK